MVSEIRPSVKPDLSDLQDPECLSQPQLAELKRVLTSGPLVFARRFGISFPSAFPPDTMLCRLCDGGSKEEQQEQ
ncbi:Potassium Voltage-Gated Channel Subfamily H Member 1 [Manis pentadactyla]|nr:Potassium Voltage-Gated Channel Subfamily H Member 1 [Manis pentadactyla]